MHPVLKNRTYWWLGATVALVLVALFQGGIGLERAGYRFGAALASKRAPDPQVAVVTVDAAALAKYGPWPWPRSRLAEFVDRLTDAKVQVAVLGADLSAPENKAALDYLTQLKQLAGTDAAAAPLNARLDEARIALDTDSILATSLLRSGRVLLAAPGSRGEGTAAPDDIAFALPVDAPAAPAVSLHAPLPVLMHAARGVGYLDRDAAASDELPLLVRDGDHAVPSLALLAAATQQGVEPGTIDVGRFGGVTLGDARISTDRATEVLLRDPDDAGAVPVYGFADVMTGTVSPERLAGKTVWFAAPDQGDAVLRAAHLATGVLNRDLVAAPWWVWAVRALMMLLVGLYLLYVLPPLKTWIGLGVSAFLAVVLLNAEYVPLLSQALWLPLLLPLLLLVLGHAAVNAVHFVRERSGVSRGDLSETNREYALALQALSRFDQAFARFQLCLPSRKLIENLMGLGQEHERGRRYSQALEVYEHVQKIAPATPDVADRLQRLRQLESTPALTRTGVAGTLSRALSSGGLSKPMLGRYELVQELGRGAMGVVYLGRDAKIGRQVAIKTLALADEFEGDTLKDVHDRFFREAETAGRLSHPNIVTIYDVGEDQGLAYIAMDYLQGESLQKYTDSKALLPIAECIAVCVKIAEALDYAHKHHVVHRDVKPANIMYERTSGRVKITDFGIAALTDMSKTKTGTILGSPLYMSPEQVSGNKLDGRSDLYSLGVTLYQLLRGELPFEAPSLTGLMFKIANEQHPDVTFLRPDIPATVKVVVDKALQKNPDDRFQNGTEMASALRLALGVKKRAS